jgi:WSC domain
MTSTSTSTLRSSSSTHLPRSSSTSVHHSSSSSSSIHFASSSSSTRPISRSTTLRTSTTTFQTKTSTSSLPVPTPSWSHVGCFLNVTSEKTPDHDLSLLFKSEKMSPEFCIWAAEAQKTAVPATTYHYVGLEHGRDCYGATAAPAPIPTSLVGASTCTNTCLGNIEGGPVEMCGGWGQYDLYASVTGSVFSAAVPTSTLA